MNGRKALNDKFSHERGKAFTPLDSGSDLSDIK